MPRHKTPSLNREGWGGSPVNGSFTHHIYSPYRVCPLGAHVDHQHGLVTGFAINKGVDLWFNVREDGIVKLKSLTFEGNIEFDISRPTQVREHNWGDYARGAKYALRKRFELSHGIEGVIQGSLPVGGLSSSAAVLIAYVMAFAKANEITLEAFEVMKIASEAEREYIGLNNGLLDREAYMPTIVKAWEYLTNVALQEDGSVGYVQPIGERAIPGQTVDQKSISNFGTGAFLLACCEMYRLVK